ncbi:MAG: hypothetical protein IJE60_09560 [Tyzzerella sp.]|nr:hypothetical protein [Tyzzerella sp.]
MKGLNKYIIMWSYEDRNGQLRGNVEILANTRKESERIFYELNSPLVVKVKNRQVFYNPNGGYVCECVLTYEEWLSEGSPEYI